MPAKHRIKSYIQGGIYHIYNKGIDGREVFAHDEDFKYFVELLKKYLRPVEQKTSLGFKTEKPSIMKHKQKMSLAGEVSLIAYCLMPDHFHLIVNQMDDKGIVKLMRRVGTAYGMYFNSKYERSGPLWENVYRAVQVLPGEQLEYLTRYVHLNPVIRTVRRFGPVETVTGSKPEEYIYSSYSRYLGLNNDNWIKNEYVKMSKEEYKKFVKDYKTEPADIIKEVKLD